MNTLSGRGQIVVESPQQSFSGRARIYIIKPDSIYIKIEALLGLDVGIFFADRETFQLYSPLENVLYYGEQKNLMPLRNYLGFDLTLDQVLRYASGLSPIFPLQQPEINNEDNTLCIGGSYADFNWDYSIDPRFGVVERVVIRDSLQTIIQIEEYKQFIKQGSVRVPRFIRLIRPKSKQSVTFFYDHLESNRSIHPGIFKINAPSDAIKIRL